MSSLIFVDCEGHGPAPTLNDSVTFEFGAVEYESRKTFHGVSGSQLTFENFHTWLKQFTPPYIFVSDNPAYDWQFINYYFHLHLKMNPFGHSARRIGDFFAGLKHDWRTPGREWKKFRVTKHTHMPVDDAMGNVEAFETILKMC